MGKLVLLYLWAVSVSMKGIYDTDLGWAGSNVRGSEDGETLQRCSHSLVAYDCNQYSGSYTDV